ncbi:MULTISPECIES: chaperone modulator CbpM [Rhizobium]|uniref:Chaperone modulator CbpM n=1 Tax=Rhizobium rhododendri TaxID=2506430 RepID=A0ABY8IHE2_9HYPH|nr:MULTISPECIES: chaperone modulator CbpM [Rhizobium]MBO9097146.1 MerR family transcriptional regulator [Rhizobium sp. L58/93]MBO9134002.1 MerR family transcriptional regulator [Rhizobium sp. B209b/85]MBO9167384.1 MerR family transcriptional regulator [Rhizobium sp. L245/93]MBO9183343.1 MerR family transcriptional regulator [Rhizobium sp. E27B/91]MBZ5759878.1 chaperone modulator CbpM [Rhizobium sp. VS19-DR96]
MDDREFRQSLHIEVSVLDVWIEQGWLVPDATEGGRAFREADVARGRLILDLIETMGLNEAGVDVVMELVDQVHGLRGTLRDLVDGIKAQGDEVQQRLIAEIEQRRDFHNS